jgi:hypothetical protein
LSKIIINFSRPPKKYTMATNQKSIRVLEESEGGGDGQKYTDL